MVKSELLEFPVSLIHSEMSFMEYLSSRVLLFRASVLLGDAEQRAVVF